jgi:hypothetical protein
MNISIEPILGIQLGTEYISDVPTPDKNINVDLIRISVFFIVIYIALDR